MGNFSRRPFIIPRLAPTGTLRCSDGGNPGPRSGAYWKTVFGGALVPLAHGDGGELCLAQGGLELDVHAVGAEVVEHQERRWANSCSRMWWPCSEATSPSSAYLLIWRAKVGLSGRCMGLE